MKTKNYLHSEKQRLFSQSGDHSSSSSSDPISSIISNDSGEEFSSTCQTEIHEDDSDEDVVLNNKIFITQAEIVAKINGSKKRSQHEAHIKRSVFVPPKKTKPAMINTNNSIPSSDTTTPILGHPSSSNHFRQLSQTLDPTTNTDFLKEHFSWSLTARRVLKDVFGHSSFLPLQLDAINATLSNRNVLLASPPGSGKSLCYQLPCMIENKLTIVVQPQLSLIYDRISYLSKIGISATYISSDRRNQETDSETVWNALQHPEDLNFKLLFITDKVVWNKNFGKIFLNLKNSGRISRLVIDESHLAVNQDDYHISQPYKALKRLLGYFQNVTVMALTSLCSSTVHTRLLKELNIRNPQLLLNSEASTIIRPNVYFEVKLKPPEKILQHVAKDIAHIIVNMYANQSGIIFCDNGHDCQAMESHLAKLDIDSSRLKICTSKQDQTERDLQFNEWMESSNVILITTYSIGFSLHKSNIRFVILYAIPSTIQEYYRVCSLVGRDGQASHCTTYFCYSDWVKHLKKNTDFSLQTLNPIIPYSLNTRECRRKLLCDILGFQQYCDAIRHSVINCCCDNCDNTMEPLITKDFTKEAVSLLKLVKDVSMKSRMSRRAVLQLWTGNDKKRNEIASREIGQGSHLDHYSTEYLIVCLVMKGYLNEIIEHTQNHEKGLSGFGYSILQLTDTSDLLMDGSLKFELKFKKPKDYLCDLVVHENGTSTKSAITNHGASTSSLQCSQSNTLDFTLLATQPVEEAECSSQGQTTSFHHVQHKVDPIEEMTERNDLSQIRSTLQVLGEALQQLRERVERISKP
ncbi:hypothetical protein C9374_009047 [Naegleria lovaniensis]|uniref:DNA 3'-5' helicase n=1 Tax=Naegleria lovaniensis TaxID=51637 RepID=A0AA88KGV6_NAELO|nr:uncharacterized protein C9374_009047 [Naegleria lovaniensis]KAG2377531.1 hypothetical protein C9374_009047 [Naegleria lovaniensis]